MSELEPDMVDGTESNFLRVSLYLLLALHGFGQVSENGIWVGNGSDFFSAVVAAANLIQGRRNQGGGARWAIDLPKFSRFIIVVV